MGAPKQEGNHFRPSTSLKKGKRKQDCFFLFVPLSNVQFEHGLDWCKNHLLLALCSTVCANAEGTNDQNDLTHVLSICIEKS